MKNQITMTKGIKFYSIAFLLVILLIPKAVYLRLYRLEVFESIFHKFNWTAHPEPTLNGIHSDEAAYYDVIKNEYLLKTKAHHVDYLKSSEHQLQKRKNNNNKSGSLSSESNSTATPNMMQAAAGNSVYMNSTYRNYSPLITNGIKVIDFIQACYLPSSLAICGVNAPIFYLTGVLVGTPAQNLQALIDINTYESYFPTCNKLVNCPVSKSQNLYSCVYNSFDGNISFSFNYANTSFFTNFVNSKSESLIKGCWGWDNYTLGFNSSKYENVNFDYFEFGTVNTVNEGCYFESLVGLGVESMISKNLYISDKEREKYYNNNTVKFQNSLLDTMKVYGLINLRVYSMYIDSNGAGKLILGGIDKSRMKSEMVYFKNVTAKYFLSSLVKMDSKSKFKLYRPSFNVTYIEIANLTNYKKSLEGLLSYDAVIESTDRFIYGPKSIIKSIASYYKLKSADNRYYINCSQTGSPLTITMNSKFNVTIPWEELLLKNLNPLTNTKKNQNCEFALNYKNTQEYFSLGQTFLNNIYFYSDLENNIFGMAEVDRSQDVEPLFLSEVVRNRQNATTSIAFD